MAPGASELLPAPRVPSMGTFATAWSGLARTYPPAVDAGVIARGTLAAWALPAALTHAGTLGAATAICKRGNVTALRPSLGFPSILGCIPGSDLPCPRSPQPVIHPSVPLRPAAGTREGGSGVVLTVAEEAGGARALQDVVLAEVPVEALHLALQVALALPADTLAPA